MKSELLPQVAQKAGKATQPTQVTDRDVKTLPQDHMPAPISIPVGNALDALIQPDQVADYIPGQLKKKGKKRKRNKNISNNQ